MKPNAGTLRGVSLAAVANSEVDALIKGAAAHDGTDADRAGSRRAGTA